MKPPVADPWAGLRTHTKARIGLPRVGSALATAPLLALRADHARARDAVAEPMDTEGLAAAFPLPTIAVASAAPDRATYLRRPDLGRRLDPASAASLAAHRGDWDLAIVVADGLSAAATHAAPVLVAALLPLLPGWRVAPVVIACEARVALGDAVAMALGAGAVAVLIGERPGLSVPVSLGVYATWRPTARSTDADRNCISNIHEAGLAPVDAANRLARLLLAMRSTGISGVGLKDDGPLLG